MRRLEIRHETALPVGELSALALRGGPEGETQLLAVGDEDFAVVSTKFTDGPVPTDVRRRDLHSALRDTQVGLEHGSAFEGAASDGAGTIVLLQEDQARLLVLAPDLSRLLQVLVLAVAADQPEIGPGWQREPNARGEGLLLLANATS